MHTLEVRLAQGADRTIAGDCPRLRASLFARTATAECVCSPYCSGGGVVIALGFEDVGESGGDLCRLEAADQIAI